jgi:hypothetical protein
MTQGQGEIKPRRCPRCGGLMQKPAGSSLYWHADNNHPRCDITNIVDTSLAVQSSDESPSEPPKSNRQKK